VKQAMVNKKQQKNFTIVAMEKVQIDHLLNKLLETYSEETETHKPAPYYKRILWLRLVLIFAVLNGPAFLIFGNDFWLINLVFLLFGLVFVHYKFKKTYYQISEAHLTIGGGFIDTITNILETHKIQALQFKQTFFQKRNGIASVVVSTASKSVVIPYIKATDAKRIYDYLLFCVESQDRDWM
jgi:putative membrane protein